MIDVRFINDSINSYQKEVQEARIRGDIDTAINYTREIAKCYLTLAKETENTDLRAEYISLLKNCTKAYEDLCSLPKKGSKPGSKGESSKGNKSTLAKKLENSKGGKEDENGLTEFRPIKPEDIKVGLDDVCGLDNVKEFIRENIILPKLHPEIFETFKVPGGSGLLMYGLPGNGKTMIAKAIAKDTNAPFYLISCADLLSKWRGDSEKNLTKLLETATQHEFAIIFFDEFETLGTKRGGRSSYDNKFVAHFLSQLGGFKDTGCKLLVIAATNRPWDIDDGLLRTGRFGTHLYVPLPDAKAREGIIKNNLKDVPVDAYGLDLPYIVEQTKDFSGSDIAEFCNNIKKRAARISLKNGSVTPINMAMVKDVLFQTHDTVDLEAAKKIRDYNLANHIWTSDCTSGVSDEEHFGVFDSPTQNNQSFRGNNTLNEQQQHKTTNNLEQHYYEQHDCNGPTQVSGPFNVGYQDFSNK